VDPENAEERSPQLFDSHFQRIARTKLIVDCCAALRRPQGSDKLIRIPEITQEFMTWSVHTSR
jgi:hypothetical protein